MALNIKNERIEQLAAELARMTGESKTAAILRALEERRDRLVAGQSRKRRMEHALDFLEKEIWPNIPRKFLGRRITKKEREEILGYAKNDR